MSDEKSLVGIVEERLSDKNLQLPVFNRTAIELQKLVSTDDYSIEKCSTLITRDQALASQILREANSSFYGGLKKITTIHDAMVRLGAKEILRITIQVAQKSLYKCNHAMFKDPMEKIWRHAIGVAYGAYWLAQKTGHQNKCQEAFLAGLMHDIGRLLVLKVLDELAAKGELKQLSDRLMMEILDTLHVEQGYRLMTVWEIPEIYTDVIRGHHTLSGMKGPGLSLLVQLANHACNKLGIGLHHEEGLSLPNTPAAIALDVKETVLAELEIMLEDKFLQDAKPAATK